MAWSLNQKEYESVLGLSGPLRYSYFIKRVSDWQQLWSLWLNSGWILYGDDQGHELIPVWPHSKFAQACATDEWAVAIPRAIDIHEWIETWTPGIMRDQRLVAVFPVPSEHGVAVSPKHLQADLQEELSRLE